ncbi:MAG: hypothetical protein CSA32_00550 [Desulfobulbus propionicus]|nr:MAG: hypothetical protein CSA32_00550 [Desulfobulbus propionicus]
MELQEQQVENVSVVRVWAEYHSYSLFCRMNEALYAEKILSWQVDGMMLDAKQAKYVLLVSCLL